MLTFDEVDWTAQVYCWACEKLLPFRLVVSKDGKRKKKFCSVCGIQIVHGPRATIIAPVGRILLAFDADALHYRIAACLSRDAFINESLVRYDETGDPIWKPHIRNCSALFQITPEQAVELMNAEAPQYTFAKNFIYMLLNGGEAPALANAAAMTGLKLTIPQVNGLVKNWLEKAGGFKLWREGLLKEAQESGQLELACGRRRRFYDLRMSKGRWVINSQTKKEIYNFPLIGTEVTFMNPVIEACSTMIEGTDWELIYHGHDGFMLEGPDRPVQICGMSNSICDRGAQPLEIRPGQSLRVPFAAKVGRCWAVMEKP